MANVYPIADNAAMTNAASSWVETGGSSAFDCIDDSAGSPDDDSTYISRVANAAIVGSPAVQLGPITDPGTDIGWAIQFRAMITSIGVASIVVDLYQGDPASAGTLLEAKSQLLSTSYSGFTFTLASATIASVSNFSDLWVRLTTSSAVAVTARLTSLYMEVPSSGLITKSALLPITGAQ